MDYEIVNYLNHTTWFKKGTNVIHRESGPAVLYNDRSKYWYKEGVLHREDGPAVEDLSGRRFSYKFDKPRLEPVIEYWYKGQKINCSSNEEYKRLLKLKIFW